MGTFSSMSYMKPIFKKALSIIILIKYRCGTFFKNGCIDKILENKAENYEKNL